MKIEVNRDMMLDAAKCAAKVTSKSQMEMLKCVLIECYEDTGDIFMTATNHEVSIQLKHKASVEVSGTALVDSRMLVKMLDSNDKEYITLSAISTSGNKNSFLAQSGKSIVEIGCPPADNYPKPVMPFPEDTITMSGICSLAKRTVLAVSKDETKGVLQCVYMKLKDNAVTAVATDSMKMMMVKDAAESPNEQTFLLPGKALQMLASISSDTDVFSVSDMGKEIVFVRGDMMFTIRKLVTGDYMDVSGVLKSIKPAYTATANASELKDALALTSVSASAGEHPKPVNITLSDNSIIFRCNNDYSTADTAVPARVVQSISGPGFFYNISALTKVFQVLKGNVKLELSDKGIMLIKTLNEVYLQSPVQAPAMKSEPIKAVANKKEKTSAKGAEGVKNKVA